MKLGDLSFGFDIGKFVVLFLAVPRQAGYNLHTPEALL